MEQLVEIRNWKLEIWHYISSTIRLRLNAKRLVLLLPTTYYLLPLVAFAQDTLLPDATKPENKWASCLNTGDCHLSDIPAFILYIANYLVGLSATITVLMVMYGGYQYVLKDTAGKGDGMKTIMNALTGMAITLFSYIIIKVLENLFTV